MKTLYQKIVAAAEPNFKKQSLIKAISLRGIKSNVVDKEVRDENDQLIPGFGITILIPGSSKRIKDSVYRFNAFYQDGIFYIRDTENAYPVMYGDTEQEPLNKFKELVMWLWKNRD
jgi:hypothetical protein